jgi:hypothetical protein
MRSLVAPSRPLPSSSPRLRSVWAGITLTAWVAAGCSAQGGGSEGGGKPQQDASAAGEAGKDQAPPPKADGAAPEGNEVIGSSDPTATPLPEAPLTDEEKRILAADPDTLTPEERKQLPHLRRKKILQNPESDSAKSLQRSAAAYSAGELPAPAVPEAAASSK